MSGPPLPGEEPRPAPPDDAATARPADPPSPGSSSSSVPPPASPTSAAAVPSSAPALSPREPPPPLEANDQLVTVVITVGWAVAVIVLLIVHADLRPGERWWLWTTVAGFGMGLFGLLYVPYLKRARVRTARRRSPGAGRR